MARVKNFLSIFAKDGRSNLVLVLVLVLESKGPYCKDLRVENPRDLNSSANLSIPGIPIDISHCFTSDISVSFRTLLNKTLEQFSHAPATSVFEDAR